jgi:hypothetical protein
MRQLAEGKARGMGEDAGMDAGGIKESSIPLCGNCPFLPLEDRIALTRERVNGARGGPAELRSIEIGRRKLHMSD